MNKLCVFCGSSIGNNPVFKKEAIALGKKMVLEHVELVYGGGSIGLMGVLADTIITLGGKVTGVIPKFLYDKEVGHDGLTELIIVETMHQRKQTMAELSEGFVAMPGGIGTLEELFEIFTWNQLNLVHHPVALLNINNYYDLQIKFLNHMVTEGFLRQNVYDHLIIENDVKSLIYNMKNYTKPLYPDKLDKT